MRVGGPGCNVLVNPGGASLCVGARSACSPLTTLNSPADALSHNYPFPDPKSDAERAGEDEYQRQEEEGAAPLRLADELPPVAPEALLEQVRLDLATASLHVAPPQPLTDEDQGGVMVYLNDDAQVVVDTLPHARLDRAALDMVETDRNDDVAVIRYEAVPSAMDTALGTILTGFRYTTRQPQFGFGHIGLPTTRWKGIRPCPHPNDRSHQGSVASTCPFLRSSPSPGRATRPDRFPRRYFE
ncbi:hypothetical protein ABZ567_30660 [Streptomyces sp. NPDC016459]|uniref:hypothetical protein n=1 Tax=Streptomyces sp. NPDC016459 TaxID=3157190 RepID=UPI0033F41385